MLFSAVVHIFLENHGILPEFHEVVGQFAFRHSQIAILQRIGFRRSGRRHGARIGQVFGDEFFGLVIPGRTRNDGGSGFFEAAARALQRPFFAAELADRGHDGIGLHLELLRHHLHIYVAQDGIGHDGHALHDIADHLRAADRIALRVLEQQLALVGDEIFLVLFDVLLDLDQGVALGEGVRVVFGRQQHHLHAQALLQHQVDAAQGGLDAGLVTVVDDGDLLGKALDQADLLHGQRGARRGHHVGDARLVHRDHVGVTFHQDALVGLGDAVLGLEDAVERAALVVDLALRAVDIFGDALVGLQGTAAEGDYAAADGVDREHDPVEEAVVELAAPLPFQAKTGSHEVFFLVAGLQGGGGKSQRARGGVAQAELADGLVGEFALAEVTQADGLAHFAVPQHVGIELLGIFAHHQQALIAHAAGDLLGRLLFLHDFDVVLLGQVAQGFPVTEVLVLHQEGDGIAGLAAGEALEDAFGG